MKDRERICAYYIRFGECSKGKEASMYGICQKCDKYLPRKGAKPNRIDKRRKTKDDLRKREFDKYGE